MSRDTQETLRVALVDRYRVERLLGSGGMASVYLAHDLKHDRQVAIKVLRPDLTAALGRERFLREIQIAASLTHPHILPLHDSGAVGDLLYYVMPYVAGETLQDRVAREKQLPIDEAVRITREVASALAYAHGNGIVHRDIKPANILLADGHAFVADFGLARAISRARSSDAITQSGLTLGTPAYMSPEQASGEGEVDGRTDVYALGCVLYELLAGDPPFVSSNPGAILARHAAAPVVPIRVVRPTTPPWLNRALQRALEKVPADRFQTAAEFAEALQPGPDAPGLPRWVAAAGVAALMLAVAWALLGPGRWPGGSAAGADTTRYAIMPFAGPAAAAGPGLEELLRGALTRWRGITLSTGEDVVRAAGAGPPGEAAARRAARRLGAGRFITGDVLVLGDSLQLRITLREPGSTAALYQTETRLAGVGVPPDTLFQMLAEALLFRGRLDRGPAEGPAGSLSVPAVEWFLAGRAAVREWNLAEADTALARAVAADPEFARAGVWLAQVRAWQGQPARAWRLHAERAAAAPARLGPRDQGLARALSALSRREFPAACGEWRGLTVAWPQDFSAWYGLATCLRLDDGVRRDPRSPSGWSFTSSYHRAQQAWRKAFELLPAIYRNFRTGGTLTNSWLLWTATNRVRSGRALPPETGQFLAFPSWRADTLAFVPYPEAEFWAGRARVAEASTLEAIRRQRRAFFELGSEWRSTDPSNPDAREALASALWLLGDPTAADSMRSARALARTGEDRARLGLTAAVMLLLHGLPDGEAALRRARRLLDSLLTDPQFTDAPDPQDLATAAALTGRADLAARLARVPSRRTAFALPPGLSNDAIALLHYAGLGGPAESLSALVTRVGTGIETAVDPADQSDSRMEWLARPLAMAQPGHPGLALDKVEGKGDYLIDAEAAMARGDTTGARRRLRDIETGRAWMQPSDVSFETLLPEAMILAAMGDSAGALRRLDPTLQAVRNASLDIVSRPVGAAMLVRTMAYRAELAGRAGDRAGAARWARAVLILWEAADPFLGSVLDRMRILARE